MLKNVKKLISLAVCAMLLPAVPMVSEAAFVINESFNEYVTNDTPSELSVNAKAYCITEYKEKDKGLLMYAGTGTSSVSFDVENTKNICISFDIMAVNNTPSGFVSAVNASGVQQQLLVFNAKKGAGGYDNFPINSFRNNNMKHYDVVYRADKKTYDVYINNKLSLFEQRIGASKISSISSVVFTFSSETGEDGVIIDNVNIFSGTEPKKKYPTAKFNEDVTDEPEFTFGEYIGNKVLTNVDFEGGMPFSAASQGNKMEIVEDDDGGHAYLMERQTSSDFHLSVNGIISDSDSLVYQFDFKVIDPNSVFILMQKDSAGVFQELGELGFGGEWIFPSGYSKQLSLNKWYNIAVIENYYNRTISFYFDKKLAGTKSIDTDFAVNGAIPEILRFHATIYTNYASKRASDTDSIKYLLDNVKIYEGNELNDNLNDIEKTIDIKTKKTVFPSDSAYKNMLSGYYAVHFRSGIVFANDEKTMLNNKPYIENGIQMFPINELAVKFGGNISGEGVVNGKIVSNAHEKNGVLYAPIDSIVSALSKVATKIEAKTNSGLTVIGNQVFKAPTEEDRLQDLNDFVFYLRPSEKVIADAYKASPQYGKHPRIQATAEDFARIREEVKTDVYKKRWSETILAQAEQLLSQEPVIYELRDGERLLQVARDVLSRMYTLGMAYQLTNDKKYSDRAYKELERVSGFSDWHPSHHLDPCEMGTAVAIGYDWMYDAFTDEQRAVIEKGMLNNCFYDASLSFQTLNSAMTNSAIATNNHNIVCNGGIAVAALSMIDVYPEISEYLLKNAIRGADIMMHHFAPYGAWYEGPHYWEYTMQYTAKFISAMETALGTSFGMSDCEGLSAAAEFELNMQTPIGIYNYGDGLLSRVYVPEMFWLSNKYNDPDVTRALLSSTEGKISDSEDLALSLLWYDTSIAPAKISMPKDKYYDDQGTVMLRNSWDDKEPTVVGIHAGKTNVDHAQLDGGSFIFEASGVRWAEDLGMGNYNSEGYWESNATGKRWSHFRSRAESHNEIIINPDDKPDHVVDSYADMKIVEEKPRGAIVTVDMSELLAQHASSAKRGFFFTDNRQSLVVRDEVNLLAESDIYWFMITDADAEISGNSVMFTYKGKKCKLDFVTNGNAAVSFNKAEPLETSPKMSDDSKETANRLAIKVHGSGKINITVKLSSANLDGSNVDEYDKDISLWSVPDGEIPTPPAIDYVVVDGKKIETNGRKNIAYSYVEGELDHVPAVSVSDEKYDISIQNASSLNDTAKIIVSDKNDINNKTIYNVNYNMILKPLEFDGRKSFAVREYSVSEEPQSENPASSLFDHNFDTRWSAEGYGQWVLLDIGNVQRIDDIAMSFYLGDKRSTKVTIAVSEDGISYEDVYNGLSCGTTDKIEFFPVGGKDARFIKIGFNGNTAGAAESWNSVSEIVVTQRLN